MENLAMLIFMCILVISAINADEPSTNQNQSNQINCGYGEWSAWTPCSATCGMNIQKMRSRSVPIPKFDMIKGTLICDDVTEMAECDISLPPCPNDCIVSIWSDWMPCNCQINQTERTREILRPPRMNGHPCPLELRQVRACASNDSCIQDCAISDWSVWSECSVPCDQGISYRQRSVKIMPLNGGEPCPNLEQIMDCDLGPCSPDQVDKTCQNTTGNFPHPSRLCTRFYISCVFGKRTWLLCPDGLRYHAQTNTCDYPHNLPECQDEFKKTNIGAQVLSKHTYF